MSDSLLSVRLPEKTKTKFEALALTQGRSMSELARLLIAHVVAEHKDALPGRMVCEPDTVRARLELRLTGSETQGIERVAAQNGMSMNRWVVSLIRAYLTRGPQFGMYELAAIAESTKALAAIGRNLNQVARALNQGQRPVDLGCGSESLRSQIESHIRSVSNAIQANVNRWRITWQ